MNPTPHPEPQTAAGTVLWHVTMSLDGFVAGPDHDMVWTSGFSGCPGLEEEYTATAGAVLGGRSGWDALPGSRPYLGLVLREARETQGVSAAELGRRTDATASDVLEFELANRAVEARGSVGWTTT